MSPIPKVCRNAPFSMSYHEVCSRLRLAVGPLADAARYCFAGSGWRSWRRRRCRAAAPGSLLCRRCAVARNCRIVRRGCRNHRLVGRLRLPLGGGPLLLAGGRRPPPPGQRGLCRCRRCVRLGDLPSNAQPRDPAGVLQAAVVRLQLLRRGCCDAAVGAHRPPSRQLLGRGDVLLALCARQTKAVSWCQAQQAEKNTPLCSAASLQAGYRAWQCTAVENCAGTSFTITTAAQPRCWVNQNAISEAKCPCPA